MLVIKYDDALDVMTRYYQAAEDEVEAIIVQLWADMKKLAVEPKAELLFEPVANSDEPSM